MPAVEQVMARQRAAWEKIATDPNPPTVKNTVEAIEHAGEEFDRVLSVAFTLFSSLGTDELNDIEAQIYQSFPNMRTLTHSISGFISVFKRLMYPMLMSKPNIGLKKS